MADADTVEAITETELHDQPDVCTSSSTSSNATLQHINSLNAARDLLEFMEVSEAHTILV